ncbi:hypothetical protein M413DRAFT_81251 [Hebeloma cylindrosporum]|uniref:Uncharacterized protein n=1 Tax=Hebeloma cylindrosporum TaxID=76867 RepID=A0A0C3CWN7_HEBCY|nr:hypothetical protein M413DRAFT_81251 [Hebeloma cylindrosporum h7]
MFRSSSPTYSESGYTMPEHNTIRATSPLHFLYPHLTLSTTQSYNSYSYASSTTTTRSKAAKQKSRRTPDHDDISRLLDPSYLPSSSSTAGVYVDPSGEVHDPDYRHFPLVTSPSHNGSHKHGHHHHTHNGNGHHHNHTARRHSGTRGRTSPRPHFDWELAVDESALDDEYPPEEEDQNHRYGYGGYSGGIGGMSSASSRRSGSSSNQHSPVIVRRPRDSSFSTATTTPTWYSPTVTDSTLPTSYELSDTFEDEKEKEAMKKEEKKKRRRLSKGDKEKAALKASDEEKRASEAVARTSVDDDSAHHSNSAIREDEDEDETIVARHQEYVPTCGQSLRRSWQAFALRFRFGLFRAQRRVTRRVHSLL